MIDPIHFNTISPPLFSTEHDSHVIENVALAIINRTTHAYRQGSTTASSSPGYHSFSFREGPDHPQEPTGQRFYSCLMVDVHQLQASDALDFFLIDLSQILQSKGYTMDGKFDVRLEKGCMAGPENNWHFDESFDTAITVCFSSRENWSTRILDFNRVPKINPQELRKKLTGVEGWLFEKSPAYMQFQQEVESLSEPARFGHWYDALTTLHRAPLLSDLGSDSPSLNDFRLFIRYLRFQ